jgi:hypothetical protein
MPAVLRLYEDNLRNDAVGAWLAPLPRLVFVVHGAATIDGKTFGAGDAWFGEGEVTMTPGAEGATCWRWELGPTNSMDGLALGAGVTSQCKLAAPLHTLPAGDLLLRGDSVGFPPGGCAYLHRHQGPGIRCLLEGGIRIDTNGHSASFGPGGAWFEAGPDAVFAQAAADRPSRFIRVMVLPRELAGKSSIQYVNAEDKDKPKSQQYKVYADAPIKRPAAV